MSKRRTEMSRVITHPVSGHKMVIKCMNDGNFDIIIKNPNEGDSKMAWAIGSLFSGGKSGTRMRLYELQ